MESPAGAADLIGNRAAVARLRAIHFWDGLRLARQRARHPGLEIDPAASTNLACARFALAPGARLRIGPGVVTERLPGRLHFHLESGAQVELGANVWLRTELGEVHLVAFEGARITVGPDSLLNACQLSAKSEVVFGRRVFIGSGSRVFDSDQHDLDDEHPEQSEPVRIGDHSWIASDTTVLKGVTIGAHCVIGTRSLVSSDIPEHTLAFGSPARPRGSVGDRTRAR